MDYDLALDFGEKIKGRCLKEGKGEQATRNRIYNGVLAMVCDDEITPKAECLAKRVVNALMPGPVKAAAVLAKIEPIAD
jgi:hypothetical protein